MPDTADVDDRPVYDYVQEVKDFRESLLQHGFRHANAPGDLVSADDTVWVSTTYTHGEYSIYAWLRPKGHGEVNESDSRVALRVTPSTDPTRVASALLALQAYSMSPTTEEWPPAQFQPLR